MIIILIHTLIIQINGFQEAMCKLKTALSNIYPTVNEVYSIDMDDLFSGLNLTFTCTNCPIQLYNYLTPLDSLQLNYTIIDMNIQQSNLYMLFNATDLYGTYNISLLDYNINIGYIYQADQQLKCYSYYKFIDCFSQDYIFIYSNKGYILYRNNYTQQLPQYTKMLTYNNYLFQAIFINQIGYINVYKYEKYSLSYLYNITNLLLTDFTISSNGTLYLLNQTLSFSMYQIDRDGSIQLIRNHETYYNFSTISQIGIQIAQNQVNLDHSFLYIVLTKDYLNVIEYEITQHFVEPGRRYNYRRIQPTIPVRISISPKFLSVSQQFAQSYFERGNVVQFNSSIINELIVEAFYETSFNNLLMEVNPINNQIIQIIDTNLTIQQLQLARILGTFRALTNGTFQINAKSIIDDRRQECNIVLNYTVLLQTDKYVYKAVQDSDLPNQSLYPKNLTFNINYMFTGPLINAIGKIDDQLQESSIITTTKQELLIENLELPDNISYSQIYFNDNSATLLLLTVSNYSIYGYMCEGRQSLQCVNIFVNTAIISTINYISISSSDQIGFEFFYAFIQEFNNKQYIQVYQLKFDNTSFVYINTLLGQIQVSGLNLSIKSNDFLLNSRDLLIVQKQLSSIYIWDTYELTKIKRIISSLDFNFPFLPQQVTCNHKHYGYTLFINNLNNLLIIEYSSLQIHIYSLTDLKLENLILTNFNIVGRNIMISQFDKNRILLSQYNIKNLENPLLIKQFIFQNKSEITYITSDDIFYYIKESQGELRIFNPELSYHSFLYQTQTINSSYISTANNRQQSYQIYGLGKIQTINPFNSLLFVPGYYGIPYVKQINYTIYVTNALSNSSYTIQQNMDVYNAQLGITVNQTKFDQENQLKLSDNGVSVFYLNLSKSVQGTIATYYIICQNGCSDSESTFELINYLQDKNSTLINGIDQVNSILYYYETESMLVQTPQQIYSVLTNKDNAVSIFYQYNTTFLTCESLSLSINYILSICLNTEKAHIIEILQYNNSIVKQIANYTLIDTNYIFKSTLYNDMLILLSGEEEVSEFGLYQQIKIYKLTDNDLRYYTTYKCKYGIVDYTFVPLYNYTLDQDNYTQLILFYTCRLPNELNYVSCLMTNNQFNLFGSSQYVSQLSKLTYFDTSFYQQIIPTIIGTNWIRLILTTSDVISFIFDLTFETQFYDKVKQFQFNQCQIISTIPPYGTFTQQNKASYIEGYLVLTFYMISTEGLTSFVALYNLNDDTSNQEPILMIGGFYQNILEFKQQAIAIKPQNPSQQQPYLFYTDPQNNSSLNYMMIQSTVELVVNATQAFGTKELLLVPQNFYTKQEIQMNVTYPILEAGPTLPWWSWLIVLFVFVLGGACVVVAAIKWKSQDGDEYSELEL